LTGTPIRICWYSKRFGFASPGAAGTSDPAKSRMAAISFFARFLAR
jgi:hypothetical protein